MTHRPAPAHRPTPWRLSALPRLSAAVAAVVLLAGCGAAAETPPAAPAAQPKAVATAAAEAEPILAQLGLAGRSATDVVDTLDQKPGERNANVLASVRYDKVVLKEGGREAAIAIPDGQFYLSVAPYVDQTHDCFYHSLTTCKGELADKSVQVKITDAAGKALVDGPVTTYSNGFVGFWLPRDITGTITVSYEGRTATSPISTGADAPTCLSTLKLV